MGNAIELPKDKELAKKIIDNHNELEKERVQQGLLGMVWGNSASIPNNVAALLICFLVLFGMIYSYCMMAIPVTEAPITIKEFWAILTPIITLSIGYLFGDKTRNK